jgi:hypothetical protein
VWDSANRKRTNPLCRVASHGLFGPWLRSGSPPVPNGHKLPETPRSASGNFRKSGKCNALPAKVKTLNHGAHGYTRMVLRADLPLIRVNSCHPWSKFMALHISGSRPKSTRIKSPALAIDAPADREQVIRSRSELRRDRKQVIALRADDQAAPPHPRPISIPRPNARSERQP